MRTAPRTPGTGIRVLTVVMRLKYFATNESVSNYKTVRTAPRTPKNGACLRRTPGTGIRVLTVVMMAKVFYHQRVCLKL